MVKLSSFPEPLNALVVGANGGLGRAFVDHLLACPNVATIHAWSRQAGDISDDKVMTATVDITDEGTIAEAARTLGAVHLVIVATGLLHDAATDFGPEKAWRDLDFDKLQRAFAVNAIGPALVAKHVLGRFPKDGRAIFAAVSARVGSISDNRLGGWYGYRASKAALNQMIRSLAIELARTRADAVCAGLHPGTVDTRLSGPFQGNVPDRQLFTPETSTGLMLDVVDGLRPSDTGQMFAYDGRVIQP